MSQRSRILIGALLVIACAQPSFAQATHSVTDDIGDARARRTDPGADGPVDPETHRFPDLVSYKIGAWQPYEPYENLFSGYWDVGADFFRLNLVFDGVVNPPGFLGIYEDFYPFKYGPNPIYGFVEIDMDADTETGGEFDYPEYRYLGNAARFGGLPADPRYFDHWALDYTAFDGDIATAPFIDRSGEEFHLVFEPWLIDGISKLEGDLDQEFEAGEKWKVYGDFLHRAHAYERFSFACCHGPPGSYEPDVELLFRHSLATNQTTISLVYPLNNAGSAAIREDGSVQPNDGDPENQNSVLEALDDLVFGVVNALPEWVTDPDFAIIENWGMKDPNAYLDPLDWQITVLVATSYTEEDPDGALFVWTDILPDAPAGDFDASGMVAIPDLTLFNTFLSTYDGVPGVDADGVVNNQVQLIDFGPNFSLFDVDYDGFVAASDRPQIGPPFTSSPSPAASPRGAVPVPP